MAKSLSLAELTALYANKAVAPSALFEQDTKTQLSVVLPGSSTADKLEKLFYKRQTGLPPRRPKAWVNDSEHNTIAICVVIVDNLHHEDIWRRWMEQEGDNQDNTQGSGRYKAQLFIHAKYPEKVTSEWVRERLIDVTFRPDWNSVEVVQSLLSVLHKALQYSPVAGHTGQDTGDLSSSQQSSNITTASTQPGACGRFLLATESCLPLFDLQTTGEMLYAQESSWLQAYHTPQGSWEAGACFRAVDPDVVPPKAVWKSLPGWVALTRLQALELVTLTHMLGGWGQQGSGGDCGSSSVYSNLCDPAYSNSYRGTYAQYWNRKPVTTNTDNGTTTTTNTGEVVSVESRTMSLAVPSSTTCADTTDAAATSTTATSSTTVTPQTALLSAWGAKGSWSDRNGSVFAPEEVFFPTLLSLLGYLRDTNRSGSSNGTSDGSSGVRIVTVTFAEWAKKGDANPIQYDRFDAHTVARMRASGAAFGRKFSEGSVTVSQWESVLQQLNSTSSSAGSGVGRYGGSSVDGRDRYDGGDYQREHYRNNNNNYNSNYSRSRHNDNNYTSNSYNNHYNNSITNNSNSYNNNYNNNNQQRGNTSSNYNSSYKNNNYSSNNKRDDSRDRDAREDSFTHKKRKY